MFWGSSFKIILRRGCKANIFLRFWLASNSRLRYLPISILLMSIVLISRAKETHGTVAQLCSRKWRRFTRPQKHSKNRQKYHSTIEKEIIKIKWWHNDFTILTRCRQEYTRWCSYHFAKQPERQTLVFKISYEDQCTLLNCTDSLYVSLLNMIS